MLVPLALLLLPLALDVGFAKHDGIDGEVPPSLPELSALLTDGEVLPSLPEFYALLDSGVFPSLLDALCPSHFFLKVKCCLPCQIYLPLTLIVN